MPKTFTISVDLPVDEKGYLDRRCHQNECQANFKIHEEDWDSKINDGEAHCPKCGVTSPSDKFRTPDQQKYIEQVGEAHAKQLLNDITSRAARKSRPKKICSGLIDITMSVSHTPDRIRTPIAKSAYQALRQDFVCETCECKYSTLGAGYFCPACGNNSAIRDFEQTISTTVTAVDLSVHVKATITEQANADTAENIHRQMLEDQVENLVTALQRVSEALYAQVPNVPPPPFNVFQRIDQASSLWKSTIGIGYDGILSMKELSFLKTMVQKRHKIGHSQGIVDDKYVEHSGDPSYSEGQRLVVAERDVLEMARVVVKLVDGLKAGTLM